MSERIPAGPGGPVARLESLTGLRWFAALAVFTLHVNIFVPLPVIGPLAGFGGTGVAFFFVLSGFVLTWTATHGDTPGRFYGRRFARIWPLLLVTTVLSIGVAHGFDFLTGSDALFATLTSLVGLQAWFPGGILNAPNPVAWSLSCEAFFYAVFPFIIRPVLRLGLRGLAWLALAAAAATWGVRQWLFLAHPELNVFTVTGSDTGLFATMSPIARLGEFVLGMAVAAAVRRGWRSPVGLRPAGAVLAVFIGGLWLWAEHPEWSGVIPYDVSNPLGAPLFALLIAAAATRDVRPAKDRTPLLAGRALTTLGMWSYAFYLVHFTVIYAVVWALEGKPGQGPGGPPAAEWAHLWPAAVALAASIAAAGLLYRLVEHPLERRLRATLSPPRTARPTPAPRPTAVQDAG